MKQAGVVKHSLVDLPYQRLMPLVLLLQIISFWLLLLTLLLLLMLLLVRLLLLILLSLFTLDCKHSRFLVLYRSQIVSNYHLYSHGISLLNSRELMLSSLVFLISHHKFPLFESWSEDHVGFTGSFLLQFLEVLQGVELFVASIASLDYHRSHVVTIVRARGQHCPFDSFS